MGLGGSGDLLFHLLLDPASNASHRREMSLSDRTFTQALRTERPLMPLRALVARTMCCA